MTIVYISIIVILLLSNIIIYLLLLSYRKESNILYQETVDQSIRLGNYALSIRLHNRTINNKQSEIDRLKNKLKRNKK